MKFPALIARKVGMTRMLDADGRLVPVTLLKVEKQRVTKMLTAEKDGYSAIQVGYYDKKEKHLTKPDITRLRKASINENFARFKELRLEADSDLAVGAEPDLTNLNAVKAIDITGFTKGRGFQGTVKRYGTKTGRRTHGSHFHRSPGSLGCRSTPGRVMKNKKQPGHMGTNQTTIENLQVMDVDAGERLVAIRGSVPGHKNGFLFMRPSFKLTKKEVTEMQNAWAENAKKAAEPVKEVETKDAESKGEGEA